MPKIAYTPKRFSDSSLDLIEQANEIIAEYAEQDFDLTLRQLYYQFVSRDTFPDDRTWSWTGTCWTKDPNGTKNATPNYKWLGTIVNDARLAGLIDWDTIVDRTRKLEKIDHWRTPADIVETCAAQFRVEGRLARCHRKGLQTVRRALLQLPWLHESVRDVVSSEAPPCSP
jgi:hypothetical protein